MTGGTWNDIEGLSWDEIERFTWEELEAFTREVYPVLAELTDRERQELFEGFRDDTLPPGLVASGDSRYTRVQAAALRIATSTFNTLTHKRAEALYALLILLWTVGHDVATDLEREHGERPPTVRQTVDRLPPAVRPVDPEPPLGPPSGVQPPAR